MSEDDITIGSIWRKRLAGPFFELRRIERIDGAVIRASTHGDADLRTFWASEFLDLYEQISSSPHIKIAGTGHRPEHIVTKRHTIEEVRSKIFAFYKDLFTWLKPVEVISGFARGFDLWLAWAAIEADVKLIAAIPHSEQARGWPEDEVDAWKLARDCASEVHVISPTYWQRDGDNAMYARNRWMVDRGDVLTSFWQGTRGGTAYTNEYAMKCGKTRLVISSL